MRLPCSETEVSQRLLLLPTTCDKYTTSTADKKRREGQLVATFECVCGCLLFGCVFWPHMYEESLQCVQTRTLRGEEVLFSSPLVVMVTKAGRYFDCRTSWTFGSCNFLTEGSLHFCICSLVNLREHWKLSASVVYMLHPFGGPAIPTESLNP